MKKYCLLAALTSAITGFAFPAAAGGVIHDIRELREATIRHQVFSNDHDLRTGGLSLVAAATAGTGSTGSSGSSDTDNGELGKKPPRPLNPHEILQIQAGLITEEEAMSGCGGASAATGPASLLPMLVAAGALLRRRAR